MKHNIYNLINKYNSIVIARHKNPDFDAYGSQFGLYYALKNYFPNKEIYAIGDTNSLNRFEDTVEISDDIKKKSLVFILDTVASQMLDEKIYSNYDKLILIDHHRNDPDIEHDIAYQVKDASSCSEIIAELLIDWNIPITKESARALYIGLIGDTGRFMYNNTTSKTFRIAAELVDVGIDIGYINNEIYVDTQKNKIVKAEFFSLVKYTKNNVAYCKNDRDFIKKYSLTTNYVSRGLVNQMSGMIEVPIWVNFTLELETNNILCEIRSRDIPVLSVAKKYQGGGHLYACGCTLKSWEETDLLLNDLDRLVEENR